MRIELLYFRRSLALGLVLLAGLLAAVLAVGLVLVGSIGRAMVAVDRGSKLARAANDG